MVGGARLTPRIGLQAGWALTTTGRLFAPVALLVLAYQRGGPGALAATSVALAVVGAVMSAVIGRLGDRRHLGWVIISMVATAGVLLVLSTVAAVLDGPLLVSLGFGTLACGLLATYRPLQASLLPWLVRTPRDLAAANVSAAAIESGAALAGPALAGAALLATTPDRALAIGAACIVLALVPMTAIRMPAAYATRVVGPVTRGSYLAGLLVLFRIGRGGAMATLVLAQTFARGALSVLLVILVIEELRVGEDVVGWLWAAMGAGGLVGAAIGRVVLRVTRLLRFFVLGVALWGVGLAVIALGSGPWVVVTGMVVIGIGNALEDPGLFTSVARLAPRGLAAQALGAVEIIVCTGMALGSAAAPGLAAALDVRPAILVIALAVLVLVAIYVRPLARLDRAEVQSAAPAELLSGAKIFEPLPLVTVEHLASRLGRREYAGGETVITEGEQGDCLYVVEEGAAEVSVRGVARPDLGPGETFGEIALLHDSPRTATVVAGGAGLAVYTLWREDFLTAIRGSSGSAEALAAARLARDEAG
ncbi:MFS transporter [Nostocoides sp. F2B08]|uniref:cyclic nucleotide-binding domain-containing protein n=1 Tax=Nostocoides sp. F2B08 TaxID=2653936 RepID=UPI0012634F35|nr:cyclic nucleotide-binding domain-containing protein [Tetrasphaera sp. F2B08]KAB7744123.1 MFS transporter [Tetrasphaera sp. F2B08]